MSLDFRCEADSAVADPGGEARAGCSGLSAVCLLLESQPNITLRGDHKVAGCAAASVSAIAESCEPAARSTGSPRCCGRQPCRRRSGKADRLCDSNKRNRGRGSAGRRRASRVGDGARVRRDIRFPAPSPRCAASPMSTGVGAARRSYDGRKASASAFRPSNPYRGFQTHIWSPASCAAGREGNSVVAA
jgi:hypothetical protein